MLDGKLLQRKRCLFFAEKLASKGIASNDAFALGWVACANRERPYIEHNSVDDHFAFPSTEWKRALGNDYRAKIKRSEMFEIVECAKRGKQTNAYRLTKSAHSLIDECNRVMQAVNDDNLSELATTSNREVKRARIVESAIRHSSTSGSKRRFTENIPSQVPVNLKSLALLRDAINIHGQALTGKVSVIANTPYLRTVQREFNQRKNQHQPYSEWAKMRLDAITEVEVAVNFTKGLKPKHILQYYTEFHTGRLTGEGVNGCCLQGTFRIIRNASLAGFYDYDMSNAHYSLFAQLAQSLGLKTDSINHYLNNKAHERERLTKLLGLPKALIKEALIAVMFGAGFVRDGGFRSIVGDDKTELLANDPFFKSLVGDVKRVGKAIVKAHRKKRGVINAQGKVYDSESCKSELAHILQGLEAHILQEVIKVVGGDHFALLVHDGFITKQPINTTHLTRMIHEKTGYKITFEGGGIEL